MVYTGEDLELFVENRRSLHGRQNICKKCLRECISRTAEFIEVFRARSPDGFIWCYFCGEEVTKLSGRDRDSLVIHSLDENHLNWSHDNKVPTHRGCHNRHHKTGKNHYAWQGDEASDDAKYQRERRRKIRKRNI